MSASLNCPSNYRGISLIPVIAKVFENAILSLCDDALVTSELQFGFKKNAGCSDAIFALRCTVEHFVTNGSSVFAASLDISKAFDCLNHFKLFSVLCTADIPIHVINLLCNWYSKLFAMVRWNGAYSNAFAIRSGVRQGSTLSPALFNIFINVFITNLKEAGLGCWVRQMFIRCLLYADDIILLSPSISGLQKMLDICYKTSCSVSLQFNVAKCHLMVLGPWQVSLVHPCP